MGNGQSVDESAVVTEMQARAAIKATFSSGGDRRKGNIRRFGRECISNEARVVKAKVRVEATT